jgi:DNA-binding transcriptional regulator YiaG
VDEAFERMLQEFSQETDRGAVLIAADIVSAHLAMAIEVLAPPEVPPISAAQIRTLRERARMSQAVFARHLNLTVGYVSQLERGKQPTGATLALLHVIRREGIETIL